MLSFKREVVYFENDGPVVLDFYDDGTFMAGSNKGIQQFKGTHKEIMAQLQAYGEQQQENIKKEVM